MANYGGSSKDKDGICGGHRQQHKRGKLGCHVAVAILVVFVLQEKAGSTATVLKKLAHEILPPSWKEQNYKLRGTKMIHV